MWKKLREIYKDNIKRQFNYLKLNRTIMLLFFLSTIFFLLQHKTFLSWDFSAYLINAKYLFHGEDYFEVYRAPLISVLLGIFLFLGNIGPYVYIVFVSSVFFISTIKLADSIHTNYLQKKRISKEITRIFFYLLVLTPFTLLFGLTEGTELLGLAFFQLFIAYLILDKPSGQYLGLAFLSRYNFLIFGIFLLINKDYKKVLKNLSLFIITILPWLIFNKYKWGNLFTSIVDSYYLNILSRQGMIERFNFLNIINPIGYLLPLLIIGLFAILISKEFKQKTTLLFIAIYGMLIFELYKIPFKIDRYAFNMITPIAFFSLIGIFWIVKNNKNIKKYILVLLFSIFITTIIILLASQINTNQSNKIFYESSEIIRSNGLLECKIVSNYWVPVNYYIGNVFFLENIDYSIKNNESVLIFKGYTTLDDRFNMSDIDKYYHLIEEEKWVLLGKESLNNETCAKRHGLDKPLVVNPCIIISTRFSQNKLRETIYNACIWIN